MANMTVDVSEVEDISILATGIATHEWQYLNGKQGRFLLHS